MGYQIELMFNLRNEIMKKLMFAICLAFGGATLVQAQQTDPSTSDQTQIQGQDQDQDRQEISISQLPDEVTAKLESQDYSGWTVGKAYKKTDAAQNNEEIYIVEMKKGTEKKDVKFDKDGNELSGREMDKSQDQQHGQGQLGDEQKDDQ